MPTSAAAFAPGQEQAPAALRAAGLVAALEAAGTAARVAAAAADNELGWCWAATARS